MDYKPSGELLERLEQVGLEVKPEYSISETQLIFGTSRQWTYKMVAKKDTLQGRKAIVDYGTHQGEAWLITIESIDAHLPTVLRNLRKRQERFENPHKFLEQDKNYRKQYRGGRSSAPSLEEMLEDADPETLKALAKKLKDLL